MFGLFAKKLPVDGEELEWLLACFAWAAESLGGFEHFSAAPLVLADGKHFPPGGSSGHARAAELFAQVRGLARMPEPDWPAELVAGESDRGSYLGGGLLLKHHGKAAPGGTFGRGEAGYRITYNPAELANPEALVATFAHELSHYRIRGFREMPPGGAALEEHATDLVAVALGFGVPMANSAKDFSLWREADSEGWQSRLRGYLSELALVTALAIFCRLGGHDPAPAERGLKPYLRGPFRAALGGLDRRFPDLRVTVAAMDLSDWA